MANPLGIFVKTMFEFKESHANVSFKLKSHVRSIKINKLYVPFVLLLMSMATREFLNYEINVRDGGGPKKILRTKLDI